MTLFPEKTCLQKKLFIKSSIKNKYKKLFFRIFFMFCQFFNLKFEVAFF